MTTLDFLKNGFPHPLYDFWVNGEKQMKNETHKLNPDHNFSFQFSISGNSLFQVRNRFLGCVRSFSGTKLLNLVSNYVDSAS